MSRLTVIVFALLVIAAVAWTPSNGDGVISDAITKFFEDRRVTKCGYQEVQLEGNVGLKQMNDPKPPCKRQCESVGKVSVWGAEQVSFGRKVICCCKPTDAE